MSTCISCWPCNIFAGSVFEMKDLHLSVSVVQVKQKLDTIQKHIPGFKASDYSIYKFFQRNHFTLRANTLLSQMLPANLEGKIIACLQKGQEEGSIGRFPYTLISNGWDPSTRYLGPNKSIDRLGANSCIIRTTGAEKRYITVVLSLWLNFSTNGYFWVKVKPEAQDTWENSCACSWTHVAPLRAADQLGLPYSNSLLTLDNFCVQTSEKIEKKMNDKSITHCVIPGGFISKLQPLDGFVNKPCRQMLKGCWSEIIYESVSESTDKAAKSKTLLTASTRLGGEGMRDDERKRQVDLQIFSGVWNYLGRSCCLKWCCLEESTWNSTATAQLSRARGWNDSELDDDPFADVELEE